MSNPQKTLDQALQLHQAGRVREAIELYAKILPQHSDNAQLLYVAGTAHLQIGQFRQSLELLQRSLAVDPDNPHARMHHGNALASLGDLEGALASFEQALALNHGLVDAHKNRGAALLGLKRPEKALASFDQALALKPDYAEAHSGRGNALKDLRRLEEAAACYDRALALKPDLAEAHNDRGNALKDLGRLEEAVACYDRALALKPGLAEIHVNRGHALTGLKRLDEALASFGQGLALKAEIPFLPGQYLHTKMLLCDWDGFPDHLHRLLEGVRQSRPVIVPFQLLALVDAPELHKLAARIYAGSRYPDRRALDMPTKRHADGRIRIGYYSADFRNHAVSYLMAELFEIHDRSRFVIDGFSFGPETDDDMRRRVSAAFDHFIDVRDKSDTEVALLSREMGIDIAVDLAGYTQHARAGAFAEGCAPVQVSYLGYIGTTGADTIDYVIADKTVIPPENQSDFTEKVAYLPHSYQVNDSKRRISDRSFTRAELGLPKSGFVFCCFNGNYKILPDTFDAWMRILQAVEASVLWLSADNPTAARNLRRQAEIRGIDGHRLVFAGRVPAAEYLARYRSADLLLDTLPYNAGTTASDALWAGLPVLTCMGRSFASRMAASLLQAIDLPELITRSQQEYEAKAIALATNPDEMRKIRDRLEHNRLTTPLFDTGRFAGHLEAAFAAMHARHQAGLPPEAIDIAP